jgi:hypothetical protein
MPGRPTGHRTPDTGRLHRTADTRTPGRPHRTLDTGHRSRGHRTRGHWTLTPDTGRRMLLRPDRLTRHGQLRIFWAITPSGCPLGCRTVFLRTAPAALGVPCRLGGEATCQCAKLPIALSAAARSLRRPSGASAHCSPRKSCGSRVVRNGDGHPLWRVQLPAAGVGAGLGGAAHGSWYGVGWAWLLSVQVKVGGGPSGVSMSERCGAGPLGSDGLSSARRVHIVPRQDST